MDLDKQTKRSYKDGKGKFETYIEQNPNMAISLTPNDMQAIYTFLQQKIGNLRKKSTISDLDKDKFIKKILSSYELFAERMTQAMKTVLINRDNAIRAYEEKGKKSKLVPKTKKELQDAFNKAVNEFIEILKKNKSRNSFN